MGIPSLKSAIFYCVSLYFHISSRETSRHHANIAKKTTADAVVIRKYVICVKISLSTNFCDSGRPCPCLQDAFLSYRTESGSQDRTR